MKSRSVTYLNAILLALAVSCASPRGFPPQHGIVNLDRVDAHVWRGGQPNRMGLEWLRVQGVQTVIDLRKDPWKGESAACASLGMDYYWAPLSGYSPPDFPTIAAVLRLIEDSPGEVFVHCQHGCDRTGVIVGCYLKSMGMDRKIAVNDARIHGMSPWFGGGATIREYRK